MRRVIENMIKVLLIVLLLGWLGMIFIDYFRSNDGKDPMFCLKEKTNRYIDGEVYICTGLGYKVFRYERKGTEKTESLNGTAFGPFFTKEKQPLPR